MANYIIVGGDHKEYGPVSEAEVRQWIAEGRLNAQSRVKAESEAEFRFLGQFPELADALPTSAPATIAPLARAADFGERDYELDIIGCFSRGMELVKNNSGLLFVAALIYMLIQFAAGAMGSIPLLGPLISIANLVCSGPLVGGLFFLFLQVNRGEPAQMGDLFSGFQRAFLHLFLGTLVQGLAILGCMIPFVVVLIVKIIPLIPQLQHLQPGMPPDAEMITAIKSLLVTCLPVALICAVPATYLSVSWKFTLPLIVDQQMEFTDAMRASWKMVNKHWWMVFGLVILISLLNVAGVLCCCVGLLITFPVGIAALMIAYETLFGTQKN